MEGRSSSLPLPQNAMLPSTSMDGESFPPLVTPEEFENMMFDSDQGDSWQNMEPPSVSLPPVPPVAEQPQPDEQPQQTETAPSRPWFGCPCCLERDSDSDTDRESDLDEPSYKEVDSAEKPPSNAESSFHLFPDLPQEIQNLIWQYAAIPTYRKMRRKITITNNAPGIKGQCFAVAPKKDRFKMHPFPPILLACKASGEVATKIFNDVEYVTSGNSAARGADNPCNSNSILYVARMFDEPQPAKMFYRYDLSWIWMFAPGSYGEAQVFDQDIGEYFKEKDKYKDTGTPINWSDPFNLRDDGSISCFEEHRGDAGEDGRWRERYSRTMYSKP